MQSTVLRQKSRARFFRRSARAAATAFTLLMPVLAWAQDVAAATARVQGFFGDVTNLLKIVSIAVVTFAIIFSGYQIAFNHKRIGDVAPVLIGGFLIGAAAQITQMLLPTNGGTHAMTVLQLLPVYA